MTSQPARSYGRGRMCSTHMSKGSRECSGFDVPPLSGSEESRAYPGTYFTVARIRMHGDATY